MEIKVQPYSFLCSEAVIDGENKKVKVIIVPIATSTTDEGFTALHSWSCNYKESCQNLHCLYVKKKSKRNF